MSRPDPHKVSSAPDFAPVFAALGDVTRLELVSRLTDGQAQSIVELSNGLGQTRQGVTKHLVVLQKAGLVERRRAGRRSLFVLREAPIASAQGYLAQVSERWDAALARLKVMVEE